MSNDKAKKAAAEKAAELVKDGMKIGLGTGSTAYFFIEKLIERCQQGLKIEAIATSKESHAQAEKGGISMLSHDQLTVLDLDVDGADEIDLAKQMIKGGGGALFREKIIASNAKEMWVIVDHSKVVQRLGAHKLPVEISPYCYLATVEKLCRLEIKGELRKHDQTLFVTDNNNYIFDADISHYTEDLKLLDQKILNIPGVIDTGFFWNLATNVFIGHEEGNVEVKDQL